MSRKPRKTDNSTQTYTPCILSPEFVDEIEAYLKQPRNSDDPVLCHVEWLKGYFAGKRRA